jgi:hypothetical protein
MYETGDRQMRQEYSPDIISEEISIDVRFVTVFQHQMLRDLHSGGLKTAVNGSES